MALKAIDDTAPPEFIETGNAMLRLVEANSHAATCLAAADEAGHQAAKDNHDATPKALRDARQAFNDWSLDKLVALHKNDINETSYHFYDDGDEEPIRGGAEAPVPLSVSQMNRLSEAAITHDKFSPSQLPRPYLAFPVMQKNQVVAYRGNLLAIFISPGTYKLIAIKQQFVWSAQSLIRARAPDAGSRRGQPASSKAGKPQVLG